MKKKICTMLGVLTLTFSLIGCGSNSELSTYKNQMNDFFNQVSEIDENINSIDPNSETAITELLSYLDELDSAFSEMAEYKVPDDFTNVEELADEASENMSLAVSTYHEAYGTDSYNEYTAAEADEYYQRANKRLQYIIDILHGEIPEGDDITIVGEEN